jgi:hypothetical protein
MGQPTVSTITRRASRRYTFRLTDAKGSPHTPPGELGRIAPGGEFELPIAPQSVEYPDRARTAQNPDADGTISADEQGASPPSVNLTGTFGESTKSNSLGVKLDGRQWQRAFESFITYYFETQRKAARQRTPPLRMEWHDSYRDAHLIVTPQMTPRGREDSSTPLRESYQITLTGLRKTTGNTRRAADASTDSALANFCPAQYQCKLDGVARHPGCLFANGVTS